MHCDPLVGTAHRRTSSNTCDNQSAESPFRASTDEIEAEVLERPEQEDGATPKTTFCSRIGSPAVPIHAPQRESSSGGSYGGRPPLATPDDINRSRKPFRIRTYHRPTGRSGFTR
jgi:hypothetical protein